MGMWRRRAFTTSVAAGAMMVMMSSTAFAHFCYNASRPAHADAKAAQSQAWARVGDLIQEELDAFLCPAGIAHFHENVGDTGLDMDATILLASTAANGRLRNANAEKLESLSSNGRGIDHLDADWEALDELFEEAFGMCPPAE